MVDRKTCVAAITIIIGIELVAVSVLLFVLGNDLVQSNVKKVEHIFCRLHFINSAFLIGKECELHEGTRIYDAWRNPPLPLKISFYFFNITNDEFLNGTKIPVVEQVGPFVYT